MNVLVSVLGKSKLDPNTGYRKAKYRFEITTHQTAFFGLALQQHLKPDRMIVMGTAGSMWDVFIESNIEDAELEETRLKLMEAVQNEAVEQGLLDTLKPLIEKVLKIPVKLLLIPYAKTMEEQVGVLQKLALSIQPNEKVSLDVTHGFRHLPMLSLVAAHYLEKVKGNAVEEIYYGALEMTNAEGETPVLKLTGLLRLMDWVQALSAYEKDGDYGPFAGLLRQEGVGLTETNRLEKAAFFERTTNPVKAHQALTGIQSIIDNIKTPIGGLFKSELTKRIRWFAKPHRDTRELELAESYLSRKDFLRAVIYLQEAYISRLVREQNKDDNNFYQRDQIRNQCKQENPTFKQLAYLRNAMAHGIAPDDRQTLATIQDETQLRTSLQSIRKQLFG